MNQYDIRDVTTQVITHSYKHNSPVPHQPEWGKLERMKWKDECSPEEIEDAIEEIEVEIVPAVPGNPDAEPPIEGRPAVTKIKCRLPQTYEVIVTDLTAQIEAEAQIKTQIQTFKQAVKIILQKADADVTTAEVKSALLKFLRASLLKGDLD